MSQQGHWLEAYEGGRGDPVEDLAFERWLVERAAAGFPCTAVWSWPGPVVVLGYAQSRDDVDLAWCREHGIPVLRRLTGGTGVIHQGDLAVSLALPESVAWAGGVHGLYDRFLGVLEPALRAVGGDVRRKQDPPRASRVRSPICFEDQLSDTLLVGDRKAVGCAQTRRGGAVLIHAAVLLGLDVGLYEGVFGVPAERISRSLTVAAPTTDWRHLGGSIVDLTGRALAVEARWQPRPPVPRRHLAAYDEARWQIVGSSRAKLRSAGNDNDRP